MRKKGEITEKQKHELGFGNKLTDSSIRLINQDGRFNVRRKGRSLSDFFNVFHNLITMPWHRFMFLVVLFYLLANVVFALGYLYLGIEHLSGIEGATTKEKFWDAFFFSSQTLTTVGYGRIAPHGFGASLLASIEALVGLLAFALVTGLLYGRFSRPISRVLFSENAILAPYKEGTALMFRLVNMRDNQMFNLKVSVILTRIEQQATGPLRKYYNLELERNEVNFLPMNWTIVHAITESSPLYEQSPLDIQNSDTEIIISLEGTQDTFSEKVYAKKSYTNLEIISNASFEPMTEPTQGKYMLLNLSKINEIKKH
jgi:inward rectifier potassium channel